MKAAPKIQVRTQSKMSVPPKVSVPMFFVLYFTLKVRFKGLDPDAPGGLLEEWILGKVMSSQCVDSP